MAAPYPRAHWCRCGGAPSRAGAVQVRMSRRSPEGRRDLPVKTFHEVAVELGVRLRKVDSHMLDTDRFELAQLADHLVGVAAEHVERRVVLPERNAKARRERWLRTAGFRRGCT